MPRYREGLTIWAQRHLGSVYCAIARVEDIAVLVRQSLPLHAADRRKTEDGCVSTGVDAFAADRIWWALESRERFRDRAFVDPVAFDKKEPRDRLPRITHFSP
jgi:hypothetical protein